MDIINDPLLFNQSHVVNHLLKPLMLMMRLGGTNKPSLDQAIYYVDKTGNHMEEHAPKLNNTYILPPEYHQVSKITKDDESNKD